MTTTTLALDRGLLLPRLARAMTASLGLGDVLAAASRAAAELVSDSLVLVWICHDDRLQLRGAAGVLETVQTGLRSELTLGEGLPGWVALHRQTVMIEDAAHDPRAARRRTGSALRSTVSWPPIARISSPRFSNRPTAP